MFNFSKNDLRNIQRIRANEFVIEANKILCKEITDLMFNVKNDLPTNVWDQCTKILLEKTKEHLNCFRESKNIVDSFFQTKEAKEDYINQTPQMREFMVKQEFAKFSKKNMINTAQDMDLFFDELRSEYEKISNLLKDYICIENIQIKIGQNEDDFLTPSFLYDKEFIISYEDRTKPMKKVIIYRDFNI